MVDLKLLASLSRRPKTSGRNYDIASRRSLTSCNGCNPRRQKAIDYLGPAGTWPPRLLLAVLAVVFIIAVG